MGRSVRWRKLTQGRPAEEHGATWQRGEHAEERCPLNRTSRRSSLVRRTHERTSRQVLHERCAAGDVQKKTVGTPVTLPYTHGRGHEQTRTVLPMTADVLARDDGGRSHPIDILVRERTGVFWRPALNLGAKGQEVIVVHAHQRKAVPGRKTDMKDRLWLADVVRHGLLKASVLPPEPGRAGRDGMRARTTIVQARADEGHQRHIVWEPATRTRSSVATDVLGTSGRRMCEALRGGQPDPETVAERTRGRCRATVPDRRNALDGCGRPHPQVLFTRMRALSDEGYVSKGENLS